MIKTSTHAPNDVMYGIACRLLFYDYVMSSFDTGSGRDWQCQNARHTNVASLRVTSGRRNRVNPCVCSLRLAQSAPDVVLTVNNFLLLFNEGSLFSLIL